MARTAAEFAAEIADLVNQRVADELDDAGLIAAMEALYVEENLSIDGLELQISELVARAKMGMRFGPIVELPSAETVDLGSAASHLIKITGDVEITSFGDSASTTNPVYEVLLTGSPTLTHSADLILPGGVDHTGEADDFLLVVYQGAGVWRVWDIRRAGVDLAGAMAAVTLAHDTKADLDLDLDHGEGVLALVWDDGANNGIYVKVGASGAGTWAPSSLYSATLQTVLDQVQPLVDAAAASAGAAGDSEDAAAASADAAAGSAAEASEDAATASDAADRATLVGDDLVTGMAGYVAEHDLMALHGARHAWDFRRGVYRKNFAALQRLTDDAGWSFERDLAAYTPEFVEFDADVIRRVTGRGAFFEPEGENLFPRFAPTVAQLGTASNVTDTSEPDDAPISGLNWLTLDGTAATAVAYQALAVNVTPTAVYVIACYVETPDNSPPVPVASSSGGDFRFIVRASNLSAPTFTVEKVAGRVWRVAARFTAPGADFNTHGIRRDPTHDHRVLKFSGFTLIAGSGALGTPIVTTGAAVTRPADLAASDDTVIDGAFTVVADVEFARPYSTADEQFVFDLHDGTDDNSLSALRETDGSLVVRASVGGVNVLNQTLGSLTQAHRARIAIAHDGTQYTPALNGVDLDPVVGAAPTTAQIMALAQRFDGTLQPGAWLRDLKVLPYAADADQRAALTQIEAIADFDFTTGAYVINDIAYPSTDLLRVPGLSFTRASKRLAYDASGALVEFASGVPARTDGVGQSIWEARTNLLLRSNNYSHTAWTKTAGGAGSAPTIEASPVAAPNGTMTASRVTFATNGVNANDRSTLSRSVTGLTTGAQSAGAIWVRADTPCQIALRHVGDGAYGVINVTTEWSRYSRIETEGATSGVFDLGLRGGFTDANTEVTVDIWNAQLELGTSSSPDIITEGAQVTRQADVAAQSGLLVAGDFTVFADFDLAAIDGMQRYLLHLTDGTSNNRLLLQRSSSNNGNITVIAAGATVFAPNFAGKTGARRLRIAVSYDGTTWRGATDGVAAAPVAAERPSNLSQMSIGGNSGVTLANGDARAIRIIPRALSDAELITLTGG